MFGTGVTVLATQNEYYFDLYCFGNLIEKIRSNN